ncbi:MAG: hypothetical protein P4M08_02660 [Oligoflexia bacterium]|nr:hypothetical protein [Oligoflexia bacterium]
MADLFSSKKTIGNSQKIREIKTWVSEYLDLGEDVGLFVTELQCTEPGCPPVEAVIALLRSNGEKTQFKVHRTLFDVTQEDVAKTLGHDLTHNNKGEASHACQE